MIITVIGGDRRYDLLAEMLRQDGYVAERFTGKWEELEEALCAADAAILPLPLTRDGVTLNGTENIPLGKALDAVRNVPLVLKDYGGTDNFKRMNGEITAECALARIIEGTECTIRGSNAAVIGAGNTGIPMAEKLMALGADVTLFSRRGENRTEDIAQSIGEFDILVNTAPAPVIGCEAVENIRAEAYCLDLASAPGGFDREAAQKRGIVIHTAPGLPGKLAPVSSAKAIHAFILPALREVENGI